MARAVATGVLDVHPGVLAGLTAFTVGALAYAVRPGASLSRRTLAGVLVVLVPVVGLALAVLVRRVRGGAVPPEPVPEPAPKRLSRVDVARLGEQPPILDRLLLGDQGERLEALVALSSAGDAEATRVLRWALEHGPSDVVLDAALTLEEIELRGEARRAALNELIATQPPTAELALSAAEASASAIHNGIADVVVAPTLAEEARAHYKRALELAPDRALEIEVRLARLELAVGRPHVALEIAERLLATATIAQDGEIDHTALTELRDDAAFAARDFEALAIEPRPLTAPIELAARKLQTVLS